MCHADEDRWIAEDIAKLGDALERNDFDAMEAFLETYCHEGFGFVDYFDGRTAQICSFQHQLVGGEGDGAGIRAVALHVLEELKRGVGGC